MDDLADMLKMSPYSPVMGFVCHANVSDSQDATADMLAQRLKVLKCDDLF